MDFGWVGVAIVAVIVLSRLLRKKPDPLFPNGPVTMTLVPNCSLPLLPALCSCLPTSPVHGSPLVV